MRLLVRNVHSLLQLAKRLDDWLLERVRAQNYRLVASVLHVFGERALRADRAPMDVPFFHA